jgi:hypothetical protein
LQGEVGRGLFERVKKIKSDPSPALPCKQGREQGAASLGSL